MDNPDLERYPPNHEHGMMPMPPTGGGAELDPDVPRDSGETTNAEAAQNDSPSVPTQVTPDNVADVLSMDQLMSDVQGTLVALEVAYAEDEGIVMDAEAVSVLVGWLRSNAGLQVALVDELDRLTVALEEATGPTRTAAGLVIPD